MITFGVIFPPLAFLASARKPSIASVSVTSCISTFGSTTVAYFCFSVPSSILWFARMKASMLFVSACFGFAAATRERSWCAVA